MAGVEPPPVIVFPPNARPTLGVELEISLLDPTTRALSPRAPEVLDALADPLHAKPELFPTIIELNTDICNSVDDVHRDLGGRLAQLQRVCGQLGIACVATGTHPFGDWRTLPISEGERYQRLVQLMRWPARRLLTCGLHVHVGMPSGEHAIALLNALRCFLPHMLAISASSPFWMGEDTGLASSRVKIFECLPTAGLPPRLANWREFLQLMRTLMTSESIASIREIWWDIRPHSTFGTLEIRICDAVNTLQEICAVTAFVQCLVVHMLDLYERGDPLPTLRTWTLRENKWRAARHGIGADIIRNERGEQVSLAQHIREWLAILAPTASRLGCTHHLADVDRILGTGPSYSRQRRLLHEHADFVDVLSTLAEELRSDTPYG